MPTDIMTYAGLNERIGEWLNRADLADRIPDFIRLFEARANRDIRTHDTVKRAGAYLDDDYVVVPDDWNETISLAVIGPMGTPAALEFVNIEQSFAKRQMYPSGPVRFYTHVDGKFLLIPGSTTETIQYELIYRAKIPYLDPTTTTTNWLIQRSPDLYLYGSLVEAEPYLKNDERMGLWKSRCDEILMSMKLEAERAAYPQGRLVTRARSF